MNTSNRLNFPTPAELEQHFRTVCPNDKDPSIEYYVEQILSLPDPLKESFLHWWHTGDVISNLEVWGLTLDSIYQEHWRKRWDMAVVFTIFSTLYQNPDDFHTYKLITRPGGIF